MKALDQNFLSVSLLVMKLIIKGMSIKKKNSKKIPIFSADMHWGVG